MQNFWKLVFVYSFQKYLIRERDELLNLRSVLPIGIYLFKVNNRSTVQSEQLRHQNEAI